MIRAAILALIAAPVAAQNVPCLPLPAAAEAMAAMGEALAVRAALRDGGTVAIWVNAETETWTLTVTSPDGRTCLIGNGVGIETIAARLPPNI